MSKKRKKLPLGEFMKRFHNEKACREYLEELRWGNGFVCPKCGCVHFCVLSNGRRQCNACHHQTSVTAGTVMHGTHAPLTTWFLLFYFVSQDKRGISAVQASNMLGVTYKTAWRMLKQIRRAMGQRDATHMLTGVVEFDDTYFGGQKVGSKRGRGTSKAKVFVALSLSVNNNPQFLKMQVTQDLTQKSVKEFANSAIEIGSTIHSDAFSSYIPALKEYDHKYQTFNPNGERLFWLHTAVSNAKSFVLGTYHGLPEKYLQSYLDEYAFRFSRRNFGGDLFERLTLSVATSSLAESKG